MADSGVGANLDIQVNVKTIADNSGALQQQLQSLSSTVSGISQSVANAQNHVASLSSVIANVGQVGVQSMGSLEAAVQNLTSTVASNVQASRTMISQYAILSRQLSTLPTSMQGAFGNILALAQSGAGAVGQQAVAVQNLQQAMGQMGQTGQGAFNGLSQQIFGSLYGLQFLVAQIRNVTNAIEKMDLLRASYARIMGANLGAGIDQATSKMMQDATRIAYQYGAEMKDVAGIMVEFARQGRSADEIVHLTEHIGELRLMLATSTGKFLSMAEAMKSATTLMTQMDISVYQATDALKLMAEYDIRAATSFSQISDAMNKFAAAGKLAGMSVPEIIKAATAFTEIGVGASRAGTALNAVLSRLSGTQQTIDAMNKVGYSLTVVEGGATRATSAFEQLVEAYKKVVASGSSTQLNKFLTDVAGARQRSVVAAGLNRYIKQTSSSVTADQFKELTSTLQRAMSQALTLPTMDVKLSTVAFSSTFDANQIKTTLKTQLDKLIQDLQTEFTQTGKVTRPDLTKLVSNWFGGLSTNEATQLIQANTELFKGLQQAIDEFMSHTESSFDRFQRYAEGATEDAKRIQREALQAMQDTITIQKNRLVTLFESTFLQKGFTDPMRAGLDQLITSVERLAHVITTVLGSALGALGFGDIERGARNAIRLLEYWVYSKLPGLLTGTLQGLAQSVVNVLPNAFGGAIKAVHGLMGSVGSGAGSTLPITALTGTNLLRSLDNLRSVMGGNVSTMGKWLSLLQQGKKEIPVVQRAIQIYGKSVGASAESIKAAQLTLPGVVAGLKGTATGAAAATPAVTGLAGAFGLLMNALSLIGTVWAVGSMIYGLWTNHTAEQTELNNGLAVMRDRITEDQKAAELASRALDSMRASSDSLGESLGRVGDYLSKFVMNNDVRSALAESIAATTNRPDLKAMPLAKRQEAVSRELLQKFPDEYIRYRNQYAQRQREAVVEGRDFTEKQLDPVEYLGRMFSIAGEYINGEFTGQLATIGTIWTTMSATVAQEMTAMLNQIDEATKTFVTNLKNYREQATTQQRRLTGETIQGATPVTAEVFTLDSEMQKKYLTDLLQRTFAGDINPNLADTPQMDLAANNLFKYYTDMAKGLGSERNIQGYLQTLQRILLPTQIAEIESKAREYGTKFGIELDHTKIKNAEDMAKYMTIIQQFLTLNSSMMGDLLKSWDAAVNKLNSSEEIEVASSITKNPKATWKTLTPQERAAVEKAYTSEQKAAFQALMAAGGSSGYEADWRDLMLHDYRNRTTVKTPKLESKKGQTTLDPEMSSHTAQMVQSAVQANEQISEATKSTTQVLNQETDAQARLKTMTDEASERVKSLQEAYQDLLNERGSWQEARSEGNANWKKYYEEELALQRETMKALEEEKRLLKENEKLRIDTAYAGNVIDPQNLENWKKIYGEAFSPQPLLDAQKEGIAQLIKFKDMLADKSLGLALSPEDLQRLQETQTKLSRYDAAVKEAYATHARAYAKAKDNLEKVKSNSQSTKAQIEAAEKAEAEARRQADETLNKTLSSLHTSLKGTFDAIDQIRLMLAEQLIQLADQGKMAQDKLKEVLAGLGFKEDEIQYATETKTVKVAKMDDNGNDVIYKHPEGQPTKRIERKKDAQGNFETPVYFMGADGKPDLSKPYTGKYEIETRDADVTITNAKISGVSLPEGTDMYGESSAVAKLLQREVPKYAHLILKYSKQEGVDPLMMAAMMKQESGYNTKAFNKDTVVSGRPDPAAGLLQFISDTARSYGITNVKRQLPDKSKIDYSDGRFDPEQTIRAGAKFMAHIMNKYGNKWGRTIDTLARGWYAGDPGRFRGHDTPTSVHARAVGAIYNSFLRRINGRGSAPVPDTAPRVDISSSEAGDALVAKQKELEELEKQRRSTSDKNELKRLDADIAKKRREIEQMKQKKSKFDEQDAKVADKAQRDRERDLLQTIQQEHQTRLQEIAETYKVIKDSEGNIIGYMNRAGSKENQEAVIAEQKRYIAGLYDVLSQTTSSELARTKVSRQIASEIAKLREAEFKLWDYQNKLQQNEWQYALEDIDRPHKFAIEMSDMTKLNSLLAEEYDLQLKLMQAEWIRTQKDEVSIQVARRKFSTTMLKNYESALKDIMTVVKQLDKAMELRQKWAGGNAATDFLREMHIKYPNLYKTYPHEQVNWQTTQAIELRDIQIQRINDRYKATSETWQTELAKLQQLMYDKMNAASGDLKFSPAQAKEIEESWKKRVATMLEEGKITQEIHDAFVTGLANGGLFAISARSMDPKTVEANISKITEKIQGVLSASEVATDAQQHIYDKWQEVTQLIQAQATKPATLTPEYLSPALDSYKQSIKGMLDAGVIGQEEYTAIMQEFQKTISIPSKTVASIDLTTALTAYKKTIDAQAEAGSIPKELSVKLWAEAEKLLSVLAKDTETVDPSALKTALGKYMAVLESQRVTDGFTQEAYTKCRNELQQAIEALIKPTERTLSLSSLQAGIEQYKQFLKAKKDAGKISAEAFDKLQSFADSELASLLQKTVPVSNQNIKDKVESFKTYLIQQMKDKVISQEDLNAILTLFGDSIEGLLVTPEMTTVDAAKNIQAYTAELEKKLNAGKLSREVFDYLVAMYKEGITSLIQGGDLDVNALQASKARATEDIQRRLSAGDITQDQAQAELAELESNFNTLLADSPLSLTDIEKQLKALKQITQTYSVHNVEERLKQYASDQSQAITKMLESIDYSKLSRGDRFINPLNPKQFVRFNESTLQALYSQVVTAYAEFGKAFEEENWRGMLDSLPKLGIQIEDQVIADIEALDATNAEKCRMLAAAFGESTEKIVDVLCKDWGASMHTLRDEFEQSISNALDQGWESGWDIGMEYGFSSEGWDALLTSWKKMAANAVKDAIWSQLKPQLQGFFTKMFSTVFDEVTKTAKDVVADAVKEQAEQAAGQAGENIAGTVAQQGLSSNWFGSMFGGLFAGIFSSLIGFAIGALFTDFTQSIREEAEAQLKAQKDRITAEGYSWNYRDPSSNVATPTYEFASPTTTESVKIIKYNTTFNITTDAAMAMASHRRELERVCSEILTQFMKVSAKTTGATGI